MDHRNLLKVVEFGINRNNCGPYEFGVQFNAKYFINIIREYYLRLNCTRLNFILCNRIIYIYGHYYQNLKIYTKINTNYINPDLVKILEGHSKELRANFDSSILLKNLDCHNFTNKESLKMYLVYDQNYNSNKSKKRGKNIDSLNPFSELPLQQSKFNNEFNFDEHAIPGKIIFETHNFKCNIESNFAPLDMINPPHIPSSIFTDYILSISIDKLGSLNQKMNPLNPLEIYCNHYICNFISNVNSENFLTYNNTEGVLFNYENALNYCKSCDFSVDESNFFQKMINFTLRKCELDAMKIINKKTAVLHFYANKKEKYYFSKECEEEGKITSAIILYSEERPLIKDIEDCCIYSEHWNEWLNYLSESLPKDCIDELKLLRKLKENQSNNNMENNTNNYKKRKQKINDQKIFVNNNINNSNNEENKEKSLNGLSLYAKDKKGNSIKYNVVEISSDLIRDVGREESTYINDKLNCNEQENNKNNENPFA